MKRTPPEQLNTVAEAVPMMWTLWWRERCEEARQEKVPGGRRMVSVTQREVAERREVRQAKEKGARAHSTL